MKTIFRFLSMAIMLSAIAVTGAFAQDACADIDAATALYGKFTENLPKKPVADKKVALEAAKEFVQKYGACEAWKDQTAYITPRIPKLEDQIKAMVDGEVLVKLFDRFDAAINSDNADELYAAGKEILAKQPDNINIMFVMAVVGPREVQKKNNKYNADSLRYAKTLYDQVKGGTIKYNRKLKDGKDSIGALKHEIGASEAQSELAYILGYVNYYGQNNKKGAVPYFYEVTQTPGFRKNFAPVYATIGDNYIAEASPIGEEIAKLIAAQKAATADEEKLKLDEQIKAKVALFNGYTERALDAFGRAWSIAKDDTPAAKTYKEGLYKEVQRLYKLRFEKDTGVNEWVATAVAKPLPDPTSAVQPSADPEPAKTTTTTTGVGAANGSGVGAANGSGVGAANGSGIGTPAGKTVGTAAKPVAAKPKPNK
jgi:hypothetical protein